MKTFIQATTSAGLICPVFPSCLLVAKPSTTSFSPSFSCQLRGYCTSLSHGNAFVCRQLSLTAVCHSQQSSSPLLPRPAYSSIPCLHSSGIPIILYLSAILEMSQHSRDKKCGTLPHRGRQALWGYPTDTTFRQSSLGCEARTR